MTTQIARDEALAGIDEIKELAGQPGPCISIYLPYEGVGTNRQMGTGRLKTALQEVTRRIGAVPETETFLLPLRKFAETETKDARLPALVIFHSPGFLKVVRCDQRFQEIINVGDRFYVLPALTGVLEPIRFNLLALSQKHVRLLNCSRNRFEPVALPEGMPTSVESHGGFDRPDHDLENRSSAGPSRGSTGRILFGTGANREDAYLYNFFKSIDRGLHPMLTRNGLPLIVAAVVEELAVYARANSFPGLLKTGIQRSPEREPDRELHRLGVEVLGQYYDERRRNELKRFVELGGREVILNSVDASRDAARQGHVAHLLVAVDSNGQQEDLNRIVLDTILHGGRISLIQQGEIAGNAVVAALLRYPAANAQETRVPEADAVAH